MADGAERRTTATKRRGPKRAAGEPAGPDQVRRALLDAAAELFVRDGVHRVSLREVAAGANVHPNLIRRYIGTRDDLVMAVFDDLSSQLAELVLRNPLAGQGHGPATVMGRWVRMLDQLVLEGRPVVGRAGFNPVLALAQTLREGYGLDDRAARVRAAQVGALALGWRVFEEYLLEAGGLGDLPVEVLRAELADTNRRIGATPWRPPSEAADDALP
ncbi:TetR/AcrR family transcriptional regulator [Agromyces aurantiacus]|uniref:TetR/AcrR family transcriptional regulator n=1 Tax=Agromyces aurantiacus TaxID=165814 RepID=A0ABV9R619_9MICO|nr:TetR/AcrR family transcriptional regulator [Agromyces aurantiacus]MBM7503847.1 AcrR family transcriptional regulator [Agromyces aurantiacus]